MVRRKTNGRLKAAIIKAGLTQRDLARKTKIPEYYISTAIHGKFNLDELQRIKIALALIDSIFGFLLDCSFMVLYRLFDGYGDILEQLTTFRGQAQLADKAGTLPAFSGISQGHEGGGDDHQQT